jgi:SAM-dependent methyltransferase
MSEADRLKWDAIYSELGPDPVPPSPLLTGLDGLLPRRGRALDLAGGAGRHALWLARRGLEVTLADLSPVAIGLARQAADAACLPLTTLLLDLESQPLPAGPWDLIVSFRYLQRSLFSAFPEALAPGGLLVFVQPTRSNLQRHERPPERFLLEDGELPRLVTGLQVLLYEEGWLADGRHEARLLARRLTQPPAA